MTTSVFSTAINAVTPFTGAEMNGLTNSSYLVGSTIIDNRPTLGSAVAYDDADLSIQFDTNVSTGSGAPWIAVWVLPSQDGSIFPPTSGGAPLGLCKIFQLQPSTAHRLIYIPGFGRLIPPARFKMQIQNVMGTGATWPANNNTVATLTLKNSAAW